MKTRFAWYFSPSHDELDHIWKCGVLTVDANVLLDLYRYHKETRDSLLRSLSKFQGGRWLSYQSCQEFFQNRTRVIASSNQAFKKAKQQIDKLDSTLRSACDQLKSNSIIPHIIAESLEKAVLQSMVTARQKIDDAEQEYPQYFKDDPILDELCYLFNGCVGEPFTEEELYALTGVAEDRRQKRIPPGYMDEDKDEDRRYGDFFMWRQIIDHARAERLPIVFVTSERKEDWWEQISGRTIGPRRELMQEAASYCGQKVLIYQTERFLQYAAERFEEPLNQLVIDEIRAVSTIRLETEGAVRVVEHKLFESSDGNNRGTLCVELRREVKNFTASGRLQPKMRGVPQLTCRLRESPGSIPVSKVSAGTGTTYDFNVHIRSDEDAMLLPTGRYVFEYEANCASID